MGNKAHTTFQNIQKKDGKAGVDYIVHKYFERLAANQSKDEVQRVHDHANIQQKEDLQFINQQVKKLEQAFEDAKREAEEKKKGSVQQAEAKSKQTAKEFSGYNAELQKLTDLQTQVKQKHAVLRKKIQSRVDEQLNKVPNKSSLTRLAQYDSKSDKQRKNIEDECLKKYPARANEFSTADIERNLSWQKFRDEFASVLDRSKVAKEGETGRTYVKNNIVSNNQPICC